MTGEGYQSLDDELKRLKSVDRLAVIAAISEELFDRQPAAYKESVLPPEAYYDAMVVSTGTRRVWPVRGRRHCSSAIAR